MSLNSDEEINNDEEINTNISEEKGDTVAEETAQDLFWKKATEVLESLKEPVATFLKVKSEKPKIPSVHELLNEVMNNLDPVIERKLIQNLVKVGILEPRSLDEFDKAQQRNNPKQSVPYDASRAALGDVKVIGQY